MAIVQAVVIFVTTSSLSVTIKAVSAAVSLRSYSSRKKPFQAAVDSEGAREKSMNSRMPVKRTDAIGTQQHLPLHGQGPSVFGRESVKQQRGA